MGYSLAYYCSVEAQPVLCLDHLKVHHSVAWQAKPFCDLRLPFFLWLLADCAPHQSLLGHREQMNNTRKQLRKNTQTLSYGQMTKVRLPELAC